MFKTVKRMLQESRERLECRAAEIQREIQQCYERRYALKNRWRDPIIPNRVSIYEVENERRIQDLLREYEGVIRKISLSLKQEEAA
jgi:hypothetical protein